MKTAESSRLSRGINDWMFCSIGFLRGSNDSASLFTVPADSSCGVINGHDNLHSAVLGGVTVQLTNDSPSRAAIC